MNSIKAKILVVDDDARLRDLLRRYLAEQGFRVDVVGDGEAMNKAFVRERYDVLVLDLMLPGEDGLAICRRLRAARNDVGIVMLTAKGDEIDRILGLEMGADDYLPKPFNPRELLARIQAVLRRRTPPAAPDAPMDADAPVCFGRFRLDLATRSLMRDGERIALTTGEFALLKVLATHPRAPLSRQKLLELARGREHEPFDRTIDIQISRLRRIVEDDAAKPRYIQTVWGIGYVFVPDAPAQ